MIESWRGSRVEQMPCRRRDIVHKTGCDDSVDEDRNLHTFFDSIHDFLERTATARPARWHAEQTLHSQHAGTRCLEGKPFPNQLRAGVDAQRSSGRRFTMRWRRILAGKNEV